MTDIQALHNVLIDRQLGAYTGEIGGVSSFASARDTLCVVGPPNAGKSTRVILQSVVSFPGLVVCTSTRHEQGSIYPDIVELSRKVRQSVADATGGVVMDLALDSAFETSSSAKTWSIVRGADDWRKAEERAATIAHASILNDRSIENPGFFRNQLKQLIGAMLFVCAKAGETDDHLIERLRRTQAHPDSSGGLLSYLELGKSLGERYGQGHPACLALKNFSDDSRLDRKTRANCFAVLEAMIIPALHQAVSTVNSGSFDLVDLFKGTSTLYIRARTSIARTAAPLVAALVSSLVDEWRSTSRTDRPHGMLLALDEVANIAPIYSLPDIMSSGGGDGITTILGIQDVRRIEHIWPGEGLGMVQGSPLLIMPGFGDGEFLNEISSLTPLAAKSHAEVTVNLKDRNIDGRLPNRDELRTMAIELDQHTMRSEPTLRRLREREAIVKLRSDLAGRGQKIGGHGSTAADFKTSLDSLAPVREASTLRHEIEAQEINQMPVGTAFLRVGAHSGFCRVPGWWESRFWSALLQI